MLWGNWMRENVEINMLGGIEKLFYIPSLTLLGWNMIWPLTLKKNISRSVLFLQMNEYASFLCKKKKGIQVHKHTHICRNIHIQPYTDMCTCVQAYEYKYINVHIHTNLPRHIYIHIHMCLNIYLCIYIICIYVHPNIHTYIHMCTKYILGTILPKFTLGNQLTFWTSL